MALTDNFGTQVYLQSCFVPSDSNIQFFLSSNRGTHYLGNSANSYILYGVSTIMVQPTTNRGTTFYAPPCSAASTPSINLASNRGTQFYFNSAFNCVTFCDTVFRSVTGSPNK